MSYYATKVKKNLKKNRRVYKVEAETECSWYEDFVVWLGFYEKWECSYVLSILISSFNNNNNNRTSQNHID